MQWILHRQQLPNLPPAVCRIEALNSFKFLKIHQVNLSVHKIGENTAHVRFDTKKNGSQITQQNYLGGGGEQTAKVVKSTRVRNMSRKKKARTRKHK